MIELTFLKKLILIQQIRDICHCWYFIVKGLKFQLYVYNGCYDILIMSINLNDIAILNFHGIDYHCIINGISKSYGANLLQNADLTQDRKKFLKNSYHIQNG